METIQMPIKMDKYIMAFYFYSGSSTFNKEMNEL